MALRLPDFRGLAYLSLCAIIAGLFTQRALSSVAMFVLPGCALALTDVRKNVQSFIRDPILIALTLIFFIYLLSAVNSTEDKSFLDERIRLKIPFLVLPFSFTVFKKDITTRQFNSVLYFFLFLLTYTSMEIAVQFFSNYSIILESYHSGKTIDTPFSHVRYSLMVAFGIVIGSYLLFKNYYLKFRWEKWILLGAVIFLIYFLHLLAVRSGILAFYLCAAYFILYLLFRKKNLKTALMIAVALIIFPVLTYYAIPPVKMKMQYMKHDLSQLLIYGNASGYSDGGRILSIEKGWELFRENIFTGVGIGDLKAEMEKKLASSPEKPNDVLLPHNQFVFVAAGTGILGLISFTLIILLPLVARKKFRIPLFVCFNIIIISSFLTEATIEEQIGTAFYLTFLLLIYSYFTYSAEPVEVL